MTIGEMRVAAQRARGYPPNRSEFWGSAPEFTRDSCEAARLLERRPDLLEAG